MQSKDDLKYYAKVHSVESFGTLDGPGIRYVLFLQGCSLRCKYCHNRDTWDINAGDYRSLDDILDNILRYKNYIKNGGVTCSGGEPLLQFEFLIELFKKLKSKGIHTCIDTSGMVGLTDKMKELINLTDLFLMDVKHIDSNKCKDLVGFSNERELAFIRYLSDIGKPMWIRQVLVPGYADDEQDLTKLREFISTLKSVKKVEVLPYHDLGKFKWEQIGEVYPLENVRTANNDDVKRAKEILEIQ